MATPKLFLVEYSFDVMVLAESEDDAIDTADESADDEFRNNFDAVSSRGHVQEIKRLASIPKPWRDGIPYAAEGCGSEDVSAAVWFDRISEAEKAKAAAGPAPGQGELALRGDSTEQVPDSRSGEESLCRSDVNVPPLPITGEA